MRLRPVHGVAIVLILVGGGVMADYALKGGFSHAGYTRVGPDAQGSVRIELADFGRNQVRFFRFLNPGNQEVKFFVGRDVSGALQVAFDSGESHAKAGRGYRHDGEWMVDNYCDTATRLVEVNEGRGRCAPVPLPFAVEGSTLVLAEDQILRGWRLFN